MELKNFWITGANGAAVSQPVATVYLPDSETLATGLVDKDGAALTNPFTGNDRGHVQFAAPDGRYDLKIVGGGREYIQRIAFSQGAEFTPPPFSVTLAVNPPATANEMLGLWQFTRDVTCPANFATSAALEIAKPAASTVYTIKRVESGDTVADAVTVGTVTYGTDGSFTFATTGGAAVNFLNGEWGLLFGPSTADATAACALTLMGE